MIQELQTYHLFLERIRSSALKSIEGLSDEQLNWRPREGYNSLGLLINHMAWAEKQWIGEHVGKIKVNRNRNAEFEPRTFTQQGLTSVQNEAAALTKKVFEDLKSEQLASGEKLAVSGYDYDIRGAILHIMTHLSHHEGQTILLRKLLNY